MTKPIYELIAELGESVPREAWDTLNHSRCMTADEIRKSERERCLKIMWAVFIEFPNTENRQDEYLLLALVRKIRERIENASNDHP